MIRWVVAQVVSGRNKVTRTGEALPPVEAVWPTSDKHVLEGYPGVSPFRDDSRLEDDGDAGLRRHVVTEGTSDIF